MGEKHLVVPPAAFCLSAHRAAAHIWPWLVGKNAAGAMLPVLPFVVQKLGLRLMKNKSDTPVGNPVGLCLWTRC